MGSEEKKSVFSTTLSIGGIEYGKGVGASKKEAEQEASRQAWEKLKDISTQPE
jgi:dsRNA-specific ribonuclease